MGDEFGEALVNFLPLLRIPSRSDFIHTGLLGIERPWVKWGAFVPRGLTLGFRRIYTWV